MSLDPLQVKLLLGATGMLFAMVFSGLLLTRAHAANVRREHRISTIVTPHLRVARVALTAFTASTERRHRSFQGWIAWLFGFDLDKTALYPAHWWIILAVTLLLSLGIRSFSDDMLGPLAWPAGLASWVGMCRQFFGWIEKRRRKVLLGQFPDALAMIVRSIRVGVPVMEAIRMISRESPEPTAAEFGRMCDQVEVGMTLEDAVVELAQRGGLPEYRFFATAIALQTQTGGTLSDTLENLADVIRKRAALVARGHAMTSEARSSSGIMAALPFLTGGFLYVSNPGYIMLLFTTPTGKQLFWSAVVLLITGMYSIRLIVQRTLR